MTPCSMDSFCPPHFCLQFSLLSATLCGCGAQEENEKTEEDNTSRMRLRSDASPACLAIAFLFDAHRVMVKGQPLLYMFIVHILVTALLQFVSTLDISTDRR